MRQNKMAKVARRIVELLTREPELRQTEIAHRLGEFDSTIMRALPYTEQIRPLLAEDEQGRLSVVE